MRVLETSRQRGQPAHTARAQGSLGNALSRLATLPGEDRGQRLYDALAAYDEALRFYRADTAPLDYAMTQNNRASILSELATLPGEDRGQRLYEALHVAWEALYIFLRCQHEQYAQICARTLQKVRLACGEDFSGLWAALEAGPVPIWLQDDPVGAVTPLQAALAAYLQLRQAADENEEAIEYWRQAAAAGDALLSLDWGSANDGVPDGLFDQIAGDLSVVYNQLGYMLDKEGDKPACAAAFAHAVAIQPQFAMAHRNLAGTLIELGELVRAAEALAIARELEPDAERLAELESQLAAARAESSESPM